jgi:ADP-heptose:LPS heptosyltransferase
MPLKKPIHRILFITLSNIGDVILTFPVFDVLRDEFPDAEIDIVMGARAVPLFEHNPNIHKIWIYKKKQPLPRLLGWLKELRDRRYDLVVDLRHTAIPLFIGAKNKTSFLVSHRPDQHKRDVHLYRLKEIFDFPNKERAKNAVFLTDEVAHSIPGQWGTNFIILSPGAANHNKRWPTVKMAQLADFLSEQYHSRVIFVGGADDKTIVRTIQDKMKTQSTDLSGDLTLLQLAHMITRCRLFIGNDSGPMHLASYLGKPVLALFGPTDPKLYGPWSPHAHFIKKKTDCAACLNPKISEHSCMEAITFEDVKSAFKISGDKIIFNT